MVTRDDWAIYDGLPSVSNIHCYKDRSGYFAIEADFGGDDYANLAYDTEYDRYSIEDPYLGLVYYSDDLNSATGFFCQFYKLSPEDCQLIADKKCELGSGEYVASATEVDKDFDVFMLMDYRADTGPDTMGMEGDTFNFLGKFFSKDLATARGELRLVQAKHPGLEYLCSGLYVTEYNPYFDGSSDDPADYYDADNNVFADLETLVEYSFDKDYLDNYDKYVEDSQEPPFDPTYVPEDNFLRNCLHEALDIVELDPDYADDIATIRYSYNMPNATYDIIIYFEDGDTIEHSFVIDKIIKLDDDQVSEGARIISNELYDALRAAGR